MEKGILGGLLALVLITGAPKAAHAASNGNTSVEQALPSPLRGASAAWVTPLTVPAPDPARKDKPLQALLLATQTRYDESGLAETHIETAALAQNAQGVAELANVALAWEPKQADLIVHRVEILRNGRARDLLGEGKSFTVLRRENSLEAATLDGVLTAVLQPDDLQVGDVLRAAWTLRRKAGAIPFRPENIVSLGHGLPIRRLFARDIWPAAAEISWRTSKAWPLKPQVRKTELGTELLIDLENAEGPEPPEGAPPRFNLAAVYEMSGYRTWGEVSRLLAPVFTTARTLPAGSPLHAEIKRIAAKAADPGARAMLALRLVQDEIRYLALQMGDGGHVPASADETWTRKFGDCKGKAVTLLALLDGLGIEAEPVLVSTRLGDVLPQRLPSIGMFDHVLVRARIGGRSYWLDGTQRGDRNLEDLVALPYPTALPVRAAAEAELEPIPFKPPISPLSETELTYDASKGFHGRVPVTGKVTYRGASAQPWFAFLAASGPEKIKEALAEALPIEEDGISITEVKADDETGHFTYAFSGDTRMYWDDVPSGRGLRFAFDQETIAWNPDFERTGSAGKDAPFQLAAPLDLMIRETVLLPNGGTGFSLDAPAIQDVLAGTEFSRTASLHGNKAVSVSRFRRLAREVDAADAAAALPKIKALSKSFAWIRTPADYVVTQTEREAILGQDAKTAEDFVSRGYFLMGEGKIKDALRDFDKAAELNPDWSLPHSNRAVALAHLHRFEEAESALERASSLDDRDSVIHQAYGIIHLGREQPQRAVDSLTKALAFDEDNVFTLRARSFGYAALGRFEDAIRDAELALELAPDDVGGHLALAQLRARAGQVDAAMAAIDKAQAQAPNLPYVQRARHRLLVKLGRPDEARKVHAVALADVDRRLRAEPTAIHLMIEKAELLAESGDARGAVTAAGNGLKRFAGNTLLLVARCTARTIGAIELPAAQKDCDEAVRNDPGDTYALAARARLGLRTGQWARTLADCAAVLKIVPRHSECVYMRGVALNRTGETEAGAAELARARRIDWDIDAAFAPLALPEAETAATAPAPTAS